jgi:hypothetical protein
MRGMSRWGRYILDLNEACGKKQWTIPAARKLRVAMLAIHLRRIVPFSARDHGTPARPAVSRRQKYGANQHVSLGITR